MLALSDGEAGADVGGGGRAHGEHGSGHGGGDQ